MANKGLPLAGSGDPDKFRLEAKCYLITKAMTMHELRVFYAKFKMSIDASVENKLHNNAAIAFLVLASTALAFFDYGGMADHYVYLYTAFQFPEIAAAGPYLKDSFFKFSSMIYPLNEFFRFQDREWLVFAFFMGSVVGGCLLVYRLLGRQFALEPWAAALTTVLMLVVDRIILPDAWPPIMRWSSSRRLPTVRHGKYELSKVSPDLPK